MPRPKKYPDELIQRGIRLALESERPIAPLLAASAGQILTSLPGVWIVRAAAFAAHTLPAERFLTPEQLYSATGLARPATSPPQSAGVAGSPALACPSTATR